MLIFNALYNYLPRPTFENEIKMLLRAILCGGRLETDSFLARQIRKMFVAVFVEKGMEMGTCSGSVLITPFNMLGNCLSSLHKCPWIVASGPMSALAWVVAWTQWYWRQ